MGILYPERSRIYTLRKWKVAFIEVETVPSNYWISYWRASPQVTRALHLENIISLHLARRNSERKNYTSSRHLTSNNQLLIYTSCSHRSQLHFHTSDVPEIETGQKQFSSQFILINKLIYKYTFTKLFHSWDSG